MIGHSIQLYAVCKDDQLSNIILSVEFLKYMESQKCRCRYDYWENPDIQTENIRSTVTCCLDKD